MKDVGFGDGLDLGFRVYGWHDAEANEVPFAALRFSKSDLNETYWVKALGRSLGAEEHRTRILSL